MSQLDPVRGGGDLGAPVRDPLCSEWGAGWAVGEAGEREVLVHDLKGVQEMVQLQFRFLI